jgi:hypothetical protein
VADSQLNPPAQRRFVEDFVSIDVGLLKRRGLFTPGGERTVEVQTRVGTFTFTCRPPEGKIRVVHEREGHRTLQTIELQVAQLRYGERPYFVCPINRERASKLYFVLGKLGSQKGHGLVHLVTTNRKADVQRGRTINLARRLKGDAIGKGPARGMRKAELITRLIALEGAKWVDPEALHIIATTVRREQDKAYREERQRRISASSTKSALEEGRRPPKNWTGDKVLLQLAEPLAMVEAGTLPALPDLNLAPDHLYPRVSLDVRTLRSEGLLEVEELKAAALLWNSRFSGVVDYTLLAADFRDPWKPYLLVENVDTFLRERNHQIIPITHAAGRWYFRCPFTNSRRTILYLREGWFGSDRALNLHRKPWDPALDPKIESDPDRDDAAQDED